jgi:hypothetical protein
MLKVLANSFGRARGSAPEAVESADEFRRAQDARGSLREMDKEAPAASDCVVSALLSQGSPRGHAAVNGQRFHQQHRIATPFAIFRVVQASNKSIERSFKSL